MKVPLEVDHIKTNERNRVEFLNLFYAAKLHWRIYQKQLE